MADDQDGKFEQTHGRENRGLSGDERDRLADDRDQISEAHEKAAEARDDRAGARDDDADVRDTAVGETNTDAATDRAEALRDRRTAARDRGHAATDRRASWSDRTVSAAERAISSVDGLTGAHCRDAGTMELEREIARAHRTRRPFVLAFLDVDGLKERNDSHGHAAGDQLLRQIIDTTRDHFRSYDLIVRLGGDEFVCGFLDLTIDEVADRFAQVNQDLAETQKASVTVGLAQLEEGNSLAALMERADEALYRERGRRPRPDRA